ncbi:MAG: peroxide stress protein YaaA [Rickettsiales bacterium]|nr:peroxide stress protein YaaA [Rickettsiales bacterium]
MILLLSPSKTLDFESIIACKHHTIPERLKDSAELIKTLRGYSPAQLSKLMDISDKLAALNVQRYQDFSTPFTTKNARQAILAFKGDVYEGIEVERYKQADFDFAQKHLRILSGLYGLLKPLDLMQPYRLEMGTRLPTKRGKDLYQFWGASLTDRLNAELKGEKQPLLVNLASEEYFKAVQPKLLQAPLLHITFKESQKGKLKVVGLFAKKARGLMANYIIRQRITHPTALQQFDESGYQFEKSHSSDHEWVFIR